jgi:hypothetical protein
VSYRYVHLGVNYGDMNRTALIDSQMNYVAKDWIRYTAADWIIWTNKPFPQLAHEVRNLISANDQFMLFEIAPGARDGWHFKWVWDWLNIARDPISGFQRTTLADLLGAYPPSPPKPLNFLPPVPPKKT